MPSTPPPSGSEFDYDLIPVGYYDSIFNRRHGIQSKWHHLKFEAIRRHIAGAGSHLDVACGPGTFIGTLPETMESVGVDISKPQVEFARSNHGKTKRTFETMQPGRLPFGDDRFDVVTCIELIEHIPEAESARLMRECFRVLRPGGQVVFTTPNYGSLWPILEQIVNRVGEVSYQNQHIARYNRSGLSEQLTAANFTGVRVETCLFCAPFAAAISWSLADIISRIESHFITPFMGHLLVGRAFKP